MLNKIARRTGFTALTLFIAATQTPASATLALNATGVSDGFTLTLAIGGFSTTSYGSYTISSLGVAANGNLIAPATGGPTYVFADTDNQTLANALTTATLPGGNGFVMATANNTVYGAQALGGGYYTFNANGTVGSAIPVSGATQWFGLWGNPANGHLLASADVGLIDIDPTNGNYTVVDPLTGYHADGVTVSPDGKFAYIADYINDEVRGFSLTNGGGYYYGQSIYNSGYLGHGSDGMGVLAGTCALAGQIVVNNNDGTVGLINPSASGETVIASGGSRGDFVSADTNNGTLLLSQDEQINRLKAPTGCTIATAATGGGTTDVPEPAGTALLGIALAGVARLRRSRHGECKAHAGVCR